MRNNTFKHNTISLLYDSILAGVSLPEYLGPRIFLTDYE